MNRYVRPVQFAFEPDVVTIFGRATFGAAGVSTLDTANSKGLCNFALDTISFTGTTANASPTVTAVSSFFGLYPSMTVTDSGPTNVNQTISSMNAGASTITLGGNATGTNTGLIASGGRYRIQLGQQAGVRLDTYNKLLGFQWTFDESAAAAIGNASTLALAPKVTHIFIVQNNVGIRTIPNTVAANLTDASFVIQMGTNFGTSFVAAAPNVGDAFRFRLGLCRSGAI